MKVVVCSKVATGSGELRVPADKGIVGECVRTRDVINVPDCYADPRFNQEVDRQTGYTTRSILSLPVKDQNGDVFAVAQLLNRKDGQPFDANDEDRFSSFIRSIGVILETQLDMRARDER